MCGRYSLTTPIDQLLQRLQGPLPPGLVEHYLPRAQVRPGEPLLLQRQEHGRLEVGLALWGLLPEWSKDPLGRRRPINARAETVAEKASFRGTWRHRRALVPANGFYEWQSRTDPTTGQVWKQPWLFRRRDQAPFWLGGLWDRWVGPDGSEVETCCLLTCAPNLLLARVHDRMPVVIPDGLEEPWLEPLDGPGLRALEPLLQPWDPAAWEAVKVRFAPAGGAVAEGADGALDAKAGAEAAKAGAKGKGKVKADAAAPAPERAPGAAAERAPGAAAERAPGAAAAERAVGAAEQLVDGAADAEAGTAEQGELWPA